VMLQVFQDEKCRSNVSQLWKKCRRLNVDYINVNQMLTICEQSFNQLSTKCRPNIDQMATKMAIKRHSNLHQMLTKCPPNFYQCEPIWMVHFLFLHM
jgi:hypothetical protein